LGDGPRRPKPQSLRSVYSAWTGERRDRQNPLETPGVGCRRSRRKGRRPCRDSGRDLATCQSPPLWGDLRQDRGGITPSTSLRNPLYSDSESPGNKTPCE
jgi:hypothetical protein